jgi:hypothetical protein
LVSDDVSGEVGRMENKPGQSKEVIYSVEFALSGEVRMDNRPGTDEAVIYWVGFALFIAGIIFGWLVRGIGK